MGMHNHWKGSGPANCAECARELRRRATFVPTAAAALKKQSRNKDGKFQPDTHGKASYGTTFAAFENKTKAEFDFLVVTHTELADPDTTSARLSVLSRHDDPTVRAAVAKHPNTDEWTHIRLSDDGDVNVLLAVAERTDIAEDIRKRALQRASQIGL